MGEELYLKLWNHVKKELDDSPNYESKLRIWDKYQLTAGNYVLRHNTNSASPIVGSNYALRANEFLLAGFDTWLSIIPSKDKVLDNIDFFVWITAKGKRWFQYSFEPIENYWQQVAKDNFPDEYLQKQLEEIEGAITNVKNGIEEYKPERDRFYPCEQLKRRMFLAGLDDFKRNQELDIEKVWTPYLKDVETHDLTALGESFLSYYDGRETGKRLKLLKDEKKRLDRGEDITKPGHVALTSANNTQDEELKMPKIAKNIEDIEVKVFQNPWIRYEEIPDDPTEFLDYKAKIISEITLRSNIMPDECAKVDRLRFEWCWEKFVGIATRIALYRLHNESFTDVQTIKTCIRDIEAFILKAESSSYEIRKHAQIIQDCPNKTTAYFKITLDVYTRKQEAPHLVAGCMEADVFAECFIILPYLKWKLQALTGSWAQNERTANIVADKRHKSVKKDQWIPDATESRRVLNRFDSYLNYEANKEAGKQNPSKLTTIIKRAIDSVCKSSDINITEKHLTRHVKNLHEQTAKQYAEQFVRQNFRHKIKIVS